MGAITKLGDSGVLLPVAGLILLCLYGLRARRTAVCWASAVALCAIATVAAKIAMQSCALGWSPSALQSPSGHTSLSTTVYGSFALVVAGEMSRWRRALALATGGLLIAAIAVSRVYVHAHTGEEVVAGLAIGAVCVSWFAWTRLRSRDPSIPWKPLIALIVFAIAICYGAHLQVEGIIHAIALRLGAHIGSCAPG